MQLIDPKIEEYCLSKSSLPSDDCLKIEEHTKAHIHGANMLIGKMEASFLGFLLQSIHAKRVLELGTFTGYSALAMAECLPANGEVVTIDVNEKTVVLAQKFWNEAASGSKIKSILGNALEIIPTLTGTFDLVFIDADKKNYLPYLKLVLPMLSESGIVVIDNVLWSGRVLPGAEQGKEEEHRNTKFIREVNDYIASEKSLYGTLMPIRDGMFLIKKNSLKNEIKII